MIKFRKQLKRKRKDFMQFFAIKNGEIFTFCRFYYKVDLLAFNNCVLVH